MLEPAKTQGVHMNFFLILILVTGFSFTANANETSAFERALETRFTRQFEYSSIDYIDDFNNSECPILASALVNVSGAPRSYECSVCLFDEGNGFFDFDSVNCDYAQD